MSRRHHRATNGGTIHYSPSFAQTRAMHRIGWPTGVCARGYVSPPRQIDNRRPCLITVASYTKRGRGGEIFEPHTRFCTRSLTTTRKGSLSSSKTLNWVARQRPLFYSQVANGGTDTRWRSPCRQKRAPRTKFAAVSRRIPTPALPRQTSDHLHCCHQK